jgi:hypothetical protein
MQFPPVSAFPNTKLLFSLRNVPNSATVAQGNPHIKAKRIIYRNSVAAAQSGKRITCTFFRRIFPEIQGSDDDAYLVRTLGGADAEVPEKDAEKNTDYSLYNFLLCGFFA